MVNDKRILREIAKRWCKGIISANEPMISFQNTGLLLEQIEVIQDECLRIMDRITKLDTPTNTSTLVDEYYE